MKDVLCAITLGVVASAGAAETAGLRLWDVEMPHHDRTAGVSIWYPDGAGGEPLLYADTPVFYGVDAALDAPVQAGTYPVVLFSHGMGGTLRAQAWLGAALAQRGAIVVSVTHANSTWGDFDMSEGVKHWTRVADMSAALDAVIADPDFADHVDLSRVMAAGFSFGGWTALSMGGVSGNHAGLVEACMTHPQMNACDVLLSDAVRLQNIDRDVWNADYSDPRVTHVAAIEPGLIWGLEVADAGGLVPDVLMIGLGDKGDRMQAADFDVSGLADLLPIARVERYAPAFHFTAMPLCKPMAAQMLAEEGDDAICTDPEGTNREAVHAAIVDAMARSLGL
ncbi:hypothetical protein [Yoonia sp. BS5-3]|uniref:Alpha/beta hydrolase family protein n=1 Tax=Yoonia phaeophyticola TaxID=3137369 RepID=A0ABZ2V4U7_9RHOB